MAGKPKRRAVIVELERRTREYFELGVEDIDKRLILDYVEEWTRGGKTLTELAVDVTTRVHFPVERQMLVRVLEYLFEGESETRLRAARVPASHAVAEQVVMIADAPVLDSADASRARNRMSSRQWLAERWNPGEYGVKVVPQVAISFDAMFLDALKARASARAVLAPVPDGASTDLKQLESVDAQVVET